MALLPASSSSSSSSSSSRRAAASVLMLVPLLLLLLPLLAPAFLLPSTPTATRSSASRSSATRLQASASSPSPSRDEFLKSALVAGVAAATAATASGPATAASAAVGDDEDEDDGKPRTVEAYLAEIDKLNLRCPDFPKSLEWINAPALSFQKELRGKLVLLDFWTYCCINCMHVLPKLAELEEKYKDQPFVVVGVHAAKFENEKDSANIREAIARYRIQHPVVNDRDMQMFSAVGVQSWPSLVLVSPKGTLVSIWPGERNEERVDQFIAASLKFYGDQGVLDRTPLKLTKPANGPKGLAGSPLSYPGKLHVDPSGAPRVFVSDSGHHRVLVVDKNDGAVLASYGSPAGEPGLEDGPATAARFNNPQGLCASRDGRTLFVCDTDNHAVRVIDLEKGVVTTLAGNGEQGFDYSGGQAGKAQYLSSPWDVVLDPTMEGKALLVAMAGTHQVWRVELPGGKAACYSGTGREAETNAGQRLEAAWAQPSGLALAADGSALYVADSESSTVRELALTGPGRTRTLVGGAKGQSLFAFGDKDGAGAGAKLQHPLAVAALPDGRVLVADSYNHKLKVVDPGASTVKTLLGAGKPGLKDGKGSGAALWEPGGLAVDPEDAGKVWVADTNNNALRVVDVATAEVTTFKVKGGQQPGQPGGKPEQPQPQGPRSIVNRRRARVIDLGTVGKGATVQLEITLPSGLEFTVTRPSEWQLLPSGLKGGIQKDGKEKGAATVKLAAGDEGPVELESVVYFCEEQQGVCRSDGVVFKLQVAGSGGGPASVVARHAVEIGKKGGAASGLAGAAGLP